MSKVVLILLLAFLLQSCNVLEEETIAPEYITLGENIITNTDIFSCKTSIYKFSKNNYLKAQDIINANWKKLPISDSITNGMSVKTKTLFFGIECGDGLGKLSEVFWNSVNSADGNYLFLGDNELIVITKEKELIFIFSVY